MTCLTRHHGESTRRRTPVRQCEPPPPHVPARRPRLEPRGKRRQSPPEEKWQAFSEVRRVGDPARRGVQVACRRVEVIKLRRFARDAVLAALASARPGRPASPVEVELEAATPRARDCPTRSSRLHDSTSVAAPS
jgi:hypothetical protein